MEEEERCIPEEEEEVSRKSSRTNGAILKEQQLAIWRRDTLEGDQSNLQVLTHCTVQMHYFTSQCITNHQHE